METLYVPFELLINHILIGHLSHGSSLRNKVLKATAKITWHFSNRFKTNLALFLHDHIVLGTVSKASFGVVLTTALVSVLYFTQ